MLANRWDLPNLGVGVGLRGDHFDHVLEHTPPVDFFEIISENFMDTGGRPLWVLDQIAERYPVVMHGVCLSIGSTDPLDFDYLTKLKALAARCGAVWLGDHVCWTGVAGHNGHDLYPMPCTEDSLRWIVERIRVVQDFLERPLVMENPSNYLEFAESDIVEAEFIARMAEDADCGLLLDVNNVYVTGRNRGIDHVDWSRVVQVHLAGHTDHGTHCIDTHIGPVIDPVWALYERVVRETGGRATLLEWDEDIPDFDTVHAEALKARRFLEERSDG